MTYYGILKREILLLVLWACIIYGVVLGSQWVYQALSPSPWYATLMFWQ